MPPIPPIQVWWQPAPLTPEQHQLLLAIVDAHDATARRGNLSATAVAYAAQGSGRYVQAIAAALMTLGDKHGPIEEVYKFLASNGPLSPKLPDYIATGKYLPGWGNAFVRGHSDPAFAQVEALLDEHWPEISLKLDTVTAHFLGAGKRLYPNPAAYTAAAAIALGLPGDAAGYLFIAGRLSAWSETYHQQRSKMPWA
jgi:citrate synthase